MKHLLPTATLAIALLAPIVPAAAAPAPKLNPLLANAKSFSVTTTEMKPNAQGKIVIVYTSHFEYMDGDKCREEDSIGDKSAYRALAVSDGTYEYFYVLTQAQYIKVASKEQRLVPLRRQMETVPGEKPTQAVIGGKPVLLYQRFVLISGKPRFVDKTWLDAKTLLPLRKDTVDLISKTPKILDRTVYSDWQINPVIPAARFVFVPPAGVKEISASAPPAEPKLLANGTIAPDFAVQDKDGKPVHLSDYKGKVVVLDFWATWCGPCQASLPHTQSVAAQFAPQGVVVLAVNVWDKHDLFEQWLPKHADFQDITFAIDPSDGSTAVTKAYGVAGIPTQYVIGKDGKIAQSFVGYDGPTDDLANALTLALKG